MALRSVLLSPLILTPTALLFGGLFYRAFPQFAVNIDSMYAVWDENAAPYVVGGLAGGILTAIVLAAVLPDWIAGAPHRAKKRADVEADERAAIEAIVAGNKRQADAEFRRWVTDCLLPWKQLLDSVGEGALIAEISTQFRENRAGANINDEERHQDYFMITWLTQKAVAFRAAGVDDATARKIHRFLDQAFHIAGQRKAWRMMQEVPGAETVVAPFFRDQVTHLTNTWGGRHDVNGAFTEFTAWAVNALAPRAAFVITAHAP